MSDRGRSISPHPLRDEDVDMDNGQRSPRAKVVNVTNLSRNVVEAHLRTIFGFYGEIIKVDMPLFGKSGQNRGKAALEFSNASAAHKAQSHMNGGQLDGAVLRVELSDLPVRSRSRSRPRAARNGRNVPRSLTRTRSPSPRPPRRRGGIETRYDSYRGRGAFGRRPQGRDTYRPHSRSRSPIRRPIGRLGPRRRSPSYERGGASYRGRSRSRSYSVRSSRSRGRSYTPSRSRTRSRSRSYSSYSRYSRSKSRSRSMSYSKGRRSYSRDDIRDSRSRSPRGDM